MIRRLFITALLSSARAQASSSNKIIAYQEDAEKVALEIASFGENKRIARIQESKEQLPSSSGNVGEIQVNETIPGNGHSLSVSEREKNAVEKAKADMIILQQTSFAKKMTNRRQTPSASPTKIRGAIFVNQGNEHDLTTSEREKKVQEELKADMKTLKQAAFTKKKRNDGTPSASPPMGEGVIFVNGTAPDKEHNLSVSVQDELTLEGKPEGIHRNKTGLSITHNFTGYGRGKGVKGPAKSQMEPLIPSESAKKGKGKNETIGSLANGEVLVADHNQSTAPLSTRTPTPTPVPTKKPTTSK